MFSLLFLDINCFLLLWLHTVNYNLNINLNLLSSIEIKETKDKVIKFEQMFHTGPLVTLRELLILLFLLLVSV